MIIDLPGFIAEGRAEWSELETRLDDLENNPDERLELPELQRFHYLYQRASADLSRLATFSAEPEFHRYLESLVARAYSEIHGGGAKGRRLSLRQWCLQTFPRTVRRHRRALALATLVTLAGVAFGGAALSLDPDAKATIMPFEALLGDPSERVAEEEAAGGAGIGGGRQSMSAFYMTHNTRVSITTMALGMTYGIGTLILLFYNGVILGAVCIDYILAGQTTFLAGWLLPHGAIEIPAILLAGQAGLVLGSAVVGWGNRHGLRARMRQVAPDLVTLIAGVALMLVWAGLIEAFFSQYHEPLIPYAVKILFGVVELGALAGFLAFAGAERPKPADATSDGP